MKKRLNITGTDTEIRAWLRIRRNSVKPGIFQKLFCKPELPDSTCDLCGKPDPDDTYYTQENDTYLCYACITKRISK